MQHGAVFQVDEAAHPFVDRFGRGHPEAPQILAQVSGIAGEHVVAVQPIGLAAETAHPLQAAHKTRFVTGAGQVHFFFGHAFLEKLGQFVVDDPFEFGKIMSRSGGGGDPEHTAQLARGLTDPHVLGDLQIIDQGLIQTGGLARPENGRQQVELRIAGMIPARAVPLHVQPGQFHRVFGQSAAFGIELGVPAGQPFHRPTRRNRPEVFFDPRLDLGWIKIPGHAQGSVVGCIVQLEELGHVFLGGGRQIVHAADHRPAVGVPFGEHHFEQNLARLGVRSVFALTFFVFNHVALVVELFLGHGGKQKAHAVGFEEQGHLQLIRRDVLPVVRAILVGRAVDLGADFLQGKKVVLVVVFRTLEHHVLEQVSKSRAARLFVFTADVVPHVHRRHGDGVILMQDDLQSVVEGVFLEREFGQVLSHSGARHQDQGQNKAGDFRDRHGLLLGKTAWGVGNDGAATCIGTRQFTIGFRVPIHKRRKKIKITAGYVFTPGYLI